MSSCSARVAPNDVVPVRAISSWTTCRNRKSVTPGTTELLRHTQAQDPGLARRQVDVTVDEPFFFPAFVVRLDLAGEELAHRLPVRLVIGLEQSALHAIPPSSCVGQAFTRDIMPARRSEISASASATMRSTSSPAVGGCRG